MNNKIKIAIGIGGLAAFIGLAYWGYNSLIPLFAPQSGLSLIASSSDSSPSSGAETDLTDEGAPSCSPVPGDTSSPDPSSEAESKAIMAFDFTMTDKDGNEVDFYDYIGEKPVVLNFWASWCPPCKSEMPDFNKLSEEMKDEVIFIMLNSTDGKRETVEKGSAYVEEQGFTFNVFYDTTLEGSTQYQLASLPNTFFINTKGELIAKAEGAIDEDTLRAGIDMITAK